MTYLKQAQWGLAVQMFRRAEDTLPQTSADYWDSKTKLTDIYLTLGRNDSTAMKEVEANIADLLKHDPNSFDGVRMQGDLDFVHSIAQYQLGHQEEGLKNLETAIAQYRKADSIK